MLLLCMFVLFICYSSGQYEGDFCYQNGVQGVCTILDNCQPAIDDIRRRRQPQICSFIGMDTIVCCVDKRQPVATTTRRPLTTSTAYVPLVYDYKETDELSEGFCENLGSNMTATKTGQKAWDKCIEYQQTLVYPCERGVALTGEMARVSKCRHHVTDLIIGGVQAGEDEFPHMVLLGFGETPDTAQWVCGGTLMSDRFILTAGHCTFSRNNGPVKYALLGVLRRKHQIDKRSLYGIQRVVKHPNYDPPRRYNDIALLETDRPIALGQSAVPACLDIGAPADYEKSLATGWGATENRGVSSDVLQKVILHRFSTDECSKMFGPDRLMKRGFDPRTQICYGDKEKSKDTCQGDSGGPLQIKHRQISCMYTIIGITSFGRACGVIGQPGIYTRVAEYVPWIESVVWP
ncbi:unnamed protein product [Pieris brassicae]|uniref:Peptidase S1 domain-containing protein n=1 Tax=Pieris brassicae TaxID=7116 RepID=A0A9P0XEY3_PIEBR|nr:unnamed protein product [Pieris brassicae]